MYKAEDICDRRCINGTDSRQMEYDRADKEVAEMSKIKVNEQRAVDEFQELTAIDAPSFGGASDGRPADREIKRTWF